MTLTGIEGFDRAVAEWIPPGSDVLLVDVPVNRNVGDLFILAATHALLGRLRCRVVYSAGVRDYRTTRARRAASRDAIVVGLGGGNFGDMYPRYEALRERVIVDFPDHRIVILPQTIHFRDPRALDRAAAALRNHGDLRIAARDPDSAAAARRMTRHVQMLPDIVDATGSAVLPGREARANRVAQLPSLAHDTLYLLRRDMERSDRLPVNGVDWPELFPGFEQRLALMALLLPAAPASLARRLYGAWTTYAGELLTDGSRAFGRAGRVVTDRLHGAVLARLSGCPVTLYDNNYGKLGAYYRAWWSDDSSITLACVGK